LTETIPSSHVTIHLCGESRHHVTTLLCDHLHWLPAIRERISFKLCYWCKRQSTVLHHVISTNCASQFRLFLTLLLSVLLLVVIWSYRKQGYNSATVHFNMAWNSLLLDVR